MEQLITRKVFCPLKTNFVSKINFRQQSEILGFEVSFMLKGRSNQRAPRSISSKHRLLNINHYLELLILCLNYLAHQIGQKKIYCSFYKYFCRVMKYCDYD